MRSFELNELLNEMLPHFSDMVSFGDFVLADSPVLALTLIESQAKKIGFPSFADFIAMRDREPPKPEKPSREHIDNLIFNNPPPAKNENEFSFFKRALERVEFDKYYNKLQDYEKLKLQQEFFKTSYSSDVQGYINFFCEESKTDSSFFFDKYKTLPISEESRERHTYIVGGSGSGKSELLKWIFYHYIARNSSTAVVLIEPHGKLSREVARWPELQGERLVYIRPGIDGEETPVFNPFDIEETQRKNPRVVSVLVDDTIEILAEILEKDFSHNMDTLLRACLYILFSRPNSTFLDILKFVDLENNAELVEQGKRIFSADSPLLAFLINDLSSQALGPTRQAVKMRLTSLLSRHFISSFLVGKSTFDIDDLIRKKKFIIFNLSSSDIGVSESRLFGKFLITHIKAFGFRQGREENNEALNHVHLHIDECQEFITPSLAVIIEQLRKFGVHLTLAQQSIGKGMSRELEGAILANTAIKATGRNSEANLRRFCAETGAKLEDLAKLEKGKGAFCVQAPGLPPTIVQTPRHRIDDKGGVSDSVWAKTFERQKTLYYTKRRKYEKYKEKQENIKDKTIIAKSNGDLEIDY